MVNNPNYAGKWNDVDCTKKNGFVCQKALGKHFREGVDKKKFTGNVEMSYTGSSQNQSLKRTLQNL